MRRLTLVVPLLALMLAACGANAPATPPGVRLPDMMEGMMQRHMAAIPAEYAGLTNPIPADAESLARGKAIYDANCAACHGESGWGDGPAAASLDPPPAPIAHTAQMLSDAHLFYRISKGGDFAPFNSAMPAWQDKLDESQRWAVINYVHSLGGSGMMPGGMMGGMTLAPARSAGVEGAPDGVMGGNMMGGGMTWWTVAPWWFLGWALVIALLAAVVLAVVWTIRRWGESARPAETSLEILKRRLARGEITRDEFEALKRQLAGD